MASAPERDVDFVDLNSRSGFYRDAAGVWRPDRRVNADRRADRIAELHIRGMRKTIRRAADREMWAFISSHASEDSEHVRHVRPVS